MGPWPDVEIELVGWLGDKLGIRHLTDLPANLDGVMPVNQVQRLGGGDDGFRLAHALVDIDTYAATRLQASKLAEATRQLLISTLPGKTTTGAVFGRVRTESAPAWRPYDNTSLRRMGATYQLFFRPVS